MTTQTTMTSTPDPSPADGLRAGLRAMWAAVAPGWRTYADHVEEQGAPVTEAMIAAAAPQPGDRILELACGAGAVGLEAAPLVGPDGTVVLSDVVPEMTAIAAERARDRGVHNVTTKVLDLEAIDEPDSSYDVVLCRHGLMLVVDPAAAAAEIRRVLRPGGRAVVAVWGPRDRNPWLTELFEAVGAHLGAPVPPPGIPQPFSLDDAERLASVLRDGGLADVRTSEVAVVMRSPSFDHWWEGRAALAGPLAKVLAGLPPATVGAMQDTARPRVAAYATPDGGYAIPGVNLLATGRRD
ncbi:class I SAM-dependent methyltransferase [Paraconexibacter sp.]|uniref:class I SAM-dependent methyltransferase n=1 Tax=Paraconexibacter sp. TaxID=2949640 RepID=UPI003562F86E